MIDITYFSNSFSNDRIHIHIKTINSVKRIVTRFRDQVLEFHDEKNENPKITLEEEKDSKLRLVANEKRMLLENTSTTCDLSFRIWKCWVIEQIRQIKDVVFIFKKSMKRSINDNDVIKKNAKMWLTSIQMSISQNVIHSQKFDERKVATFDRMKKYLNNTNYQRQNLQYACNNIDIVWREEDTIYRFLEMILSTQLQYWQSIIVQFLHDMKSHSHLRECILINYMKIDKTFEALTYLMSMSSSIALVIDESLLMHTLYLELLSSWFVKDFHNSHVLFVTFERFSQFFAKCFMLLIMI